MVPKISANVNCLNITDIFHLDFSKNSFFLTILPVPIKEIPIKKPLEIRSRKLPTKVTHNEHDFFVTTRSIITHASDFSGLSASGNRHQINGHTFR